MAALVATAWLMATMLSFAPPSPVRAEPGMFRSSATGTNTTTSSLDIPRPAGVVSGDVLVAAITVRSAPTITAPDGWTLIRTDTWRSAIRQAAYVRVAGDAEPTTSTWTFSGAQTATGAISAYTGVDPGNPIDAHGGLASAASTEIVAPSITTTTPNTLLVGIFGITSRRTITPPGGMTERFEVASPNGVDSKMTTASADTVRASAGATESRTAVASGASANIGQLIALRAADAGPPPDGADPTANPGSLVTAQDTPVNVVLSGSDTETCELIFSTVSAPTNGSLGAIDDEACTAGSPHVDTAGVLYTPDAGYSGPDAFTYRVTDGAGGFAEATVTIDVAGEPADGASLRSSSSGTNATTSSLELPLPAGTAQGDLLLAAISIRNNPVITPPPGWTWLRTDTRGALAQSIYWHVAGASEPASHLWGFSEAQTAVGVVAAFVGVDTADPIDAHGGQGNANSTSITAPTITTTAANALLVDLSGIAGRKEIDAPPTMTEAVEIASPNGVSSKLTLSLATETWAAVGGTGTRVGTAASRGVNIGQLVALNAQTDVTPGPPVATAQAVTTDEDAAVLITLTGSDPNGDPLTFGLGSMPTDGTLYAGDSTDPADEILAPGPLAGAVLTYLPDANFHGPDSFTFTVDDGTTASAPATVTLSVTPLNDLPAAADDAYTTDEGVALPVPAPGVLANDTDADGDSLTAVLVGDAANGTLTLDADGSFSYAPNPGFSGSESFTYTANDASGPSNAATVSITVEAADNGAPTANAQSVVLDEDASALISLTGSDPEGDALSFAIASLPADGTLYAGDSTAPANEITAPGPLAGNQVTYVPDADTNGPDSFTFTVTDGTTSSAPATVSLTVTAINDGPTAVGDSYTTDEDTVLNIAAPGVLTNDTDPDGDSLTAVLVGDVANGSLTLNADGSFSYTPDPGYSGPDSFTYTADDAGGPSNTATVSLTIEAAEPPFSVNINFNSATGGQPVGYLRDFGEGYGLRTGADQGSSTYTYGWVTPNTHTPLSLVGNGRDRGSAQPDQRLDTLLHMQGDDIVSDGGTFSGVALEGAWEIAVPNGTYTVTVAAGEPAVNNYVADPEHHGLNVDGVAAITPFAPVGPAGSSGHHRVATVVVDVTDGILTIDAFGAVNTKINYVDITAGSDPDVTPPSAPSSITAAPAGETIGLSWSANISQLDLAGFDVFRSTTSPVATDGTPLNASPLPFSATTFTDDTALAGTLYHYVVVALDSAGNRAVSDEASAMLAPPALDLLINFQDAATVVPAGYLRDSGQPYGLRTAADQGTGQYFYGWIDPDTGAPIDMGTQARNRTSTGQDNLELATLIHMTHPTTPPDGHWKIAVPDGAYSVTVAVGDSSVGVDAESHTINAEGINVISGFVPSGAAGTDTRHATGSATVTVSDGFLSIDDTGGTNTKINWIEITGGTPDTSAPAAPTNLIATAGDASVSLDWDDSADDDLAGYDVFRSTTSPVATTGTPLNTGLLTASAFTDTTASNGTTYFYVVMAVDHRFNDSAPSTEVNATPEAAAAPCTPWSTLECPDLPVALPFSLSWSADEGALLAGDGLGTGFTLVQPKANAGTGGPYLPANLDVNTTSGTLAILTTNGIQYRSGTLTANANTLDNGLGVAFDPGSGATIETTVINPPGTTNQAQQGGLWFGLNQDNYIKVVVVSTGTNTVKVQALREWNGGVSTTTDLLEFNTASNLSSAQTYRLILALDPAAGTATASYAVGAGAPVQVGSTFTGLPASWFTTTTPSVGASSLTSAGIFATHRNGPSALTYTFGEFLITSPNAAPTATPQSVAAEEDTPLLITLAGADADGDTLGFAIESLATSGTLYEGDSTAPADEITAPGALTGTTVTYVPDAGFSGSDSFTFSADDGTDTSAPATVSITVNDVVPCSPWSSLTCPELPAALPFGLTWATDEGGLLAGDGLGTGFTLVQPKTNPGTGGPYLPANLDVDTAAGTLAIVTTNGIQYRSGTLTPNANTLDNGLGVAFDPGAGATIETTVINPPTPGNSSQQAGLWFGLNEDNYVKVVVVSTGTSTVKVQALREANGGVTVAPSADLLEFNTGNLSPTATYRLILELDPAAGSATASYQAGAAAPVVLGTFTGLPASWFTTTTPSVGATSLTSAGIFATHRNGTTPVTYTFGEFTITPEVPPDEPFVADVNFQSETAPVPAGYMRDFGEAYGPRSGADQGTGQTYGWLNANTLAPVSLVTNGRDRDRAGIDQLLDTFIHMQYGDIPDGTNGIDTPGTWQIAVPDGSYEVTLAVGDQASGTNGYDSLHAINVEEVAAIDGFQGSASQEYLQVTLQVGVLDGALTIDAKGGTNTKLSFVRIERTATEPFVTDVNPDNRSTDVFLDESVASGTSIPGIGDAIDTDTLTSATVWLENAATGVDVPAQVGTDAAFAAITLDPTANLAPNTTYRFVVDGLMTEDGATFLPYASLFTTGTETSDDPGGGTFEPVEGVAFEKVDQLAGLGHYIASMAVGPDRKLYATTIGEGMFRYDIAADGSLSNETAIAPYLIGRAAIGLVFDPSATAANPVVWVTHATANIDSEQDKWSSKVTRLSGPTLGTVQDVFVGLPRSLRDHLSNSITFGPDGDLYFMQGSNSAAGAPDNAWGNREEQLLTAAVLHFDPDAVLGMTLPINVQTAEGGTYNPFAAGAPLQIFATGIRNAYDLVWHSNGHLYVPTNGTAAGGNSPGIDVNGSTYTRLGSNFSGSTDYADECLNNRISGTPYTGGDVPAVNFHPTQRDYLFEVDEGGFYGHPNPSRCEWVLNAGPDTPGGDGSDYPSTLDPDPNYRGFAYDFEYNKSPNGVIEYQSSMFGGALEGRIIVVRFSNGNDLFTLQADDDGTILGAQSGATIPGFSSFDDPLEVVEDPLTGNLYVNQYDREGSDQRLWLLRAQPTTGIDSNVDELVFSSTQAGTDGPQTATVTNIGDEPVTLTTGVTGTNAADFDVTGGDGVTLNPTQSTNISVTFDPGVVGVLSAEITVGGGEAQPVMIGLYGLSAAGEGGGNEPTLQNVVNTLGYPFDVGWTNLNGGTQANAKGDEVLEPLFTRFSDGPVEMVPVASYAPFEVVPFGWYTEDGTLNQVGALANGQQQTLHPTLASGGTTFDPGTSTFGFYYHSNVFDRTGYTEDSRNDGDEGVLHRARIYPAVDRAGTPIAHTYYVAFEDAANGDYQDYDFLVSNVIPAGEVPPGDEVHINFNSQTGEQPAGYLRDYGLAYGVQGDLSFGWLAAATGDPLSLVGNGRDRASIQPDQRLDTLLHMQYGDVSTPTNGITTEGIWELALPPGTYQVTVGVGDPTIDGMAADYPTHIINVEGVQAVSHSVTDVEPAGSAARHEIGTVTVDVIDGNLTLDAFGGHNTKINFVDVIPQGAVDTEFVDRVNFQTTATTTPAGWTADTGQAYLVTRGFGWVVPGASTPLDKTDSTRNRSTDATATGDVLLDTLNIMQNDVVTALDDGAWEYALLDGTYIVTVSVGDPSFTDSTHGLAIEGVSAISGFTPTTSNRFATATVTVDVTDGRLTVEATGSNTKINWITISVPSDGGDIFPPNIDIELDGDTGMSGAYVGPVTVTASAVDVGGSGIASLSYSLDGGASQTYTGPFDVTTAGEHTVEVTAVDGEGNDATETETFTIEVFPPTNAAAGLVNLDYPRVAGTVPDGLYDDWMVLSRINGGTTSHLFHDSGSVQLTNTGSGDPLVIQGMTLTGPDADAFTVPGGLAGFSIPDGASATIGVDFIESSGAKGVRQALLTIFTNLPSNPSIEIDLRGAYMTTPEGDNELSLSQYAQAFGYTTDIGGPLDEANDSPLAGDEVRSELWERVDTTQPVYVRQLAAFHGCFNQDTITIGGSSVTHEGEYCQSVLPPNNGSTGPTQMTVNPTSPFAIQISGYTTDTTGNLGVRTWPVEFNGVVVENAWFIGQDFVAGGCGTGSANCDYNDNVYLITNIAPEGTIPDPEPDPLDPPVRINAGGPAQNVGGVNWLACTAIASCNGLVTGGFPYSEADTIGGVQAPANPAIYQTEWTGGQSNGVPVGGTAFTFDVPLEDGGYTVRLHFVELNKTAANQRLFDVEIENVEVLSNYDIWTEAGGIDQAIVEEFGATVTDGSLTIDFIRQVENAKISGIEILAGLPGGGQVSVPFRVNSGGPQVTTGGVTWLADQYQSGGRAYSNPSLTVGEIDGTTDDVLYLTEYSSGTNLGSIAYDIPIANGSYDVVLHFAEIYFGAQGGGAGNDGGERVFDVSLEGAMVIDNHDINLQVGPQHALLETFSNVAVTGGNLDINMTASVNQPAISAIEVLPAGSAGPGPGPALTYANIAAQPFSVSEAQGETVGNLLYSLGGFDSTKACCTPTVRSYVYNPGTNAWTATANLPHTNGGGASHAGTTTDGTDIFLAGGYISNVGNTGQIFGTTEVYQYDISADSYVALPALPEARAAGVLEYVGGDLHFVSGTNLARTADPTTHWVLDLANLPAGWVVAAPLPAGRNHAGSAVIGGELYVVGGQTGHDAASVTHDEAWVYNPGTNTWTAIADLPTARGHISSGTFAWDGKVVVAGGMPMHGTSISDVSVYDPALDAWTVATPLPAARSSGVAGALPDGSFVYSGGSGSATGWRATPT